MSLKSVNEWLDITLSLYIFCTCKMFKWLMINDFFFFGKILNQIVNIIWFTHKKKKVNVWWCGGQNVENSQGMCHLWKP